MLVGPQVNGVRSVDLRADKVSTANILLAMRVKDLTYSADLPLSGELKGELGRDGLPTYFRGKLTAGAGTIIDSDTPDYPMAIDSAEMNVEWDSGRRVLVAPFKIISGANRITLAGPSRAAQRQRSPTGRQAFPAAPSCSPAPTASSR